MNCIQLFNKVAVSSACEKINYSDLISQQPKEIIFHIFDHLSYEELKTCSKVSRRWRRLTLDPSFWDAFDLRKISPSLSVFDASDWAKHFDLASFRLSVEDAPPLDKRRMIPKLKRYLAFFPVEGDAGLTILTVPKGLTFDNLVKLAGLPMRGKITPFRYIWDRISTRIGDIPVDKTYRIVITNSVFKESKGLSYEDQKVLVSTKGCEMPKTLEVAALLVVTFIKSGKRLCSIDPWTFMRCMEPGVHVGGFSPYGGINVYEDGGRGCLSIGAGGRFAEVLGKKRS